MSQAHHRGEYPADWNAIAKAVKDDASWCCVRCNHPHQPAVGRCLTVHHFDGNKSNCERWNLMPLCQACHLSVQARVDPASPLLFEPAAWAIPFIGGFYESGGGVPGPLYDAAAWRERFERETKKPWPTWAHAGATR